MSAELFLDVESPSAADLLTRRAERISDWVVAREPKWVQDLEGFYRRWLERLLVVEDVVTRGGRVQDIGSQSIVPLLRLEPGQSFLDLCAAPGNKTAQALEAGVVPEIARSTDVDQVMLQAKKSNPDITARQLLELRRALSAAATNCTITATCDKRAVFKGVRFDLSQLPAASSSLARPPGRPLEHPQRRRCESLVRRARRPCRSREAIEAIATSCHTRWNRSGACCPPRWTHSAYRLA